MRLTYRGREFAVVETGQSSYPYMLVGKRGARYALYRSCEEPDFMFVLDVHTMRVLPGWFKVEDGCLMQVA